MNTKSNLRTVKALAELLDKHKLESIEVDGIKLVKATHFETIYIREKPKEDKPLNQPNGEPDYKDIFPPELFWNSNH